MGVKIESDQYGQDSAILVKILFVLVKIQVLLVSFFHASAFTHDEKNLDHYSKIFTKNPDLRPS